MLAGSFRKMIVVAGSIAAGAAPLACRPQADSPPQTAPPSGEPVATAPVEVELAAPIPPKLLTDEELAEGWISLFDGQTLFGWRAETDANWRVEDGAIVVDSGQPGLLRTTTPFADYILRLDFRSEPGANSGVFLHTTGEMGDVAADCYELNIADEDNPFPTGSLVQRKRGEGRFDNRQWQTYEVTMSGPQVTVKLDGDEVLAYEDPGPLRRGYIGVQLNRGKVEFRNVRLKPLNLDSLFNGEDLSGWNTYPEMDSVFSVSDEGWLHVQGGRGQLETKKAYGDFVLQLECITHAPELNSGVFFRCIPGEPMNGYECQIHNGFRSGDRSKPVDCGTGGFFRRQDARFVVADDLSWFFLTLIADGPHMAAWVNGCPVSDWTDERPASANPRRGLRLEPGTIMLQGHDATTNISFRNLRGAETPKRKS